jgi:hypothetical protein
MAEVESNKGAVNRYGRLLDIPHCSTGMPNQSQSRCLLVFSSCSATTAQSPAGRSGTVISTTPLWAALASARSAAENCSGQPCAVLNTSTPTTPCAFLTFSTSTVKRYPAGAAPLSSEAKTLRYTASVPVVARRGIVPSRPGLPGRRRTPTNRKRPRSAAATGSASEVTSHHHLDLPFDVALVLTAACRA